MPRSGKMAVEETAFFMCDIQEKFRQAIRYFPEITDAAQKLLQLSKLLKIPLIVTEQYPSGLGNTVAELDINHAVGVHQKTKFSMVVPEVIRFLDGPIGKQIEVVVLFGIEAHICVEQTAMDLLGHGKIVHIVADATSSRSQDDRILAFERLRQIGCFVDTTESIIFKLVKDKGHPLFNDIRQMIKNVTHDTGLSKM
ncbi:isochorismatase domain-containing protein 1-like [Ornithodoros turicata]|uniref:Isochorismatase domain-containing protein 1 n=1 Tax=Ornithodoros turicata TaxID=34597 RepID=A0A2R5LGX7_9ACAR